MLGRPLTMLALVLPVCMACTSTPVRTTDGDLAAEGYDVVAYFEEGAAVTGSAEHRHQWRGAEWYFANPEHREAFADEPQRYAPAYGGWCAWALADGRVARGDPQHWTLHDDRLYFNCDRAANERWQADIERNIERAEANWPDLVTGR